MAGRSPVEKALAKGIAALSTSQALAPKAERDSRRVLERARGGRLRMVVEGFNTGEVSHKTIGASR